MLKLIRKGKLTKVEKVPTKYATNFKTENKSEIPDPGVYFHPTV
jgi:hypothetical protein